MNITKFIEFLNRTKGWGLKSDYYAHVEEWKQWWQGYFSAFHGYETRESDGSTKKRQLYTMRMPKKICEDWASLLLNERTGIVAADNGTQKWLMGDNETSGVLGDLQFWPKANSLVELAFRSGTGAFVLGVDGVTVDRSNKVARSPDAKLYMDYLPAEYIIPITVRHGEVVDVAFASEVVSGGKSCIYLQTHQLSAEGYVISNEYFRGTSDNEESGSYIEAPLPSGMLKEIRTGSRVPWFALLRPNVVKNRIGGAGLGMAVFAEAIDQVKAVDRAFNNLVKDLELGGKKVFYDQTLVRQEFENGKIVTITPDDVMQQLFLQMGDGEDAESKNPIHEYNPSLRIQENVDAVQNALNYLSFKCGLGTRHYQFSGSNVTTATQYSGDRQDMRQNVAKHAIYVEQALQQIVRAILWVGKTILGAPVDPDTEITVSFDDGYFTDNETTRALMAQDVRDGIIPKWKYAARWYDLDEDAAKELVVEAGGSDDAPALFGGDA